MAANGTKDLIRDLEAKLADSFQDTLDVLLETFDAMESRVIDLEEAQAVMEFRLAALEKGVRGVA
jgi:hypothetical protein